MRNKVRCYYIKENSGSKYQKNYTFTIVIDDVYTVNYNFVKDTLQDIFWECFYFKQDIIKKLEESNELKCILISCNIKITDVIYVFSETLAKLIKQERENE